MGVKEARLLKDQWTQVTADGRPSAHFEHTLALTKDGVRILTGPPEAASATC
jgi:methionyl aminopeptidase